MLNFLNKISNHNHNSKSILYLQPYTFNREFKDHAHNNDNREQLNISDINKNM